MEELCVSSPKCLNYVTLLIIYANICAVFFLYQSTENTLSPVNELHTAENMNPGLKKGHASF